MRKKLSIWLELGKVRITAAVSITTATGYLLQSADLTFSLIWTIPGIFLLASGASSLNHLQEFRYDSRMKRTLNRPLPSGRISVTGAVTVTLLLSISGSILLLAGAELYGLLLGWLAFFWYNIVYTYLKRLTAWAVIPGSLIGSIPPVIGWVSAGGSLMEPTLLPMAGFFFTWQVPHFWLLIMKYGKEYEMAGFPSLSGILSPTRLGRMIFGWILGTAMVTYLFTQFGPLDSMIARIGLWLSSAWLLYAFLPLLKKSTSPFQPDRYFMRINYFVLMAVIFMCLDKLLLVRVESWL
jgi:protoheme IX farnesyltransferase